VVCLVCDPAGPLIGSARGLGSAASFQPGTCLDEDEVPTDCAMAHDAEVYAQVSLPEGAWPGDDAIGTASDEVCRSEFEAYVGTAYGWAAGDRDVLCLVFDPEGPLTGSVRGSGQ
jgi:Septum formation